MCFAGIEGESLLLLLDQAGDRSVLRLRLHQRQPGPQPCASGHRRTGGGGPRLLRLSLSGENTPAQVAHIAETVPRVVAYLRSISPVWEQMQNEKA